MADGPSAAGPAPSGLGERVRLGLLAMLGTLIVQNALGIYVNLFVILSIPPDLGAVFPVILSNAVLTVHAAVAMALLAGSIWLAAGPSRRRGSQFRTLSLLLVADIATTAYMGYHFAGTLDNIYSFSMEMGFLGALVLVLWLRSMLPEPSRPEPGVHPERRPFAADLR